MAYARASCPGGRTNYVLPLGMIGTIVPLHAWPGVGPHHPYRTGWCPRMSMVMVWYCMVWYGQVKLLFCCYILLLLIRQGQLRSTQVRGAASFPFRLHGCCVLSCCFCCCSRCWLLSVRAKATRPQRGSSLISHQVAWLLRPVLLLLI